jgi:hypothetical protein
MSQTTSSSPLSLLVFLECGSLPSDCTFEKRFPRADHLVHAPSGHCWKALSAALQKQKRIIPQRAFIPWLHISRVHPAIAGLSGHFFVGGGRQVSRLFLEMLSRVLYYTPASGTGSPLSKNGSNCCTPFQSMGGDSLVNDGAPSSRMRQTDTSSMTCNLCGFQLHVVQCSAGQIACGLRNPDHCCSSALWTP